MNKDHSVFKEKITSFFSFNQHCGLIQSYHAQMCLLIGTGSQVSDVAHGPLVYVFISIQHSFLKKYLNITKRLTIYAFKQPHAPSIPQPLPTR